MINILDNNIFSKSNKNFGKFGTPANTVDLQLLHEHKKPNKIRDEVPTLNQYGYMKSELEYFSNNFIELAQKSSKPVLEIGTAYGWLTHRVLESGGKIVASDICKKHLEILLAEAPKEYIDNLYIYKGMFPNELSFETNSLNVIMASRVLHFLEGSALEKGLDKIHDWLAPEGKFIATNCSIYHSCVKEKMSEVFQTRIANNDKWPGMTTKNEFDSVHKDFSPEFLNCFYKEQLEELLKKHRFKIENISYFDYPSDPWPDEGRGHIGFIVTKI